MLLFIGACHNYTKYDIVTVTFKIKGHGAKPKKVHKFVSMNNCNYVSILQCFRDIGSLHDILQQGRQRPKVMMLNEREYMIHKFLSMNKCNHVFIYHCFRDICIISCSCDL